MTEKQIQSLMKNLKCTREEAIAVIMEDEEVDKMSMKEINDSMTAEEKAARKKYTKTTAKAEKTVRAPRKRAENPDKQLIISEIAKKIEEICGNSTISNKEREVSFTFNEKSYSIQLICHRKQSRKALFLY